MKVGFDTPLLDTLRARRVPAAGAGPMAPAAGPATAGAHPTGAANGAPSFGRVLDDALSSVSQAQNDASRMQRQYQSGEAGVTLEDTMLAMQKAQVAFTAANTVRNRLVSAYTEIMNMSV